MNYNSANRAIDAPFNKPEQSKSDAAENMRHFEGQDNMGRVTDAQNDEEAEEEELEENDHVSVPLIFVVLTFAGYIIIGGLIFQSREEWSLINATYYTFISLSTIGKYKQAQIKNKKCLYLFANIYRIFCIGGYK